MIHKILTPLVDFRLSDTEIRQYRILNLIILMLIGTVVIYALIHFIKADHFQACVITGFGVPALYMLLRLRSTADIQHISSVLIFTIFMFIQSILLINSAANYTLLWSFLFVHVALLLKGSRVGMYYTLFFYLFVVIHAFLAIGSELSYEEFFRFFAISGLNIVMAYFHTYFVEHSLNKQRELVVKLEKSVQQVASLSVTDELTQLPNRRYFNDIFTKEFMRSKRDNTPFIFTIIDIDNFKKYNDTYGHSQGDTALKSVANVFRNFTARSSDYAFRIGGEEFAIIIPARNDNAKGYLEKLKASVRELNIIHKGNEPFGVVTISMGLVYLTKYDNVTTETIYSIADENLYKAKASGRNAIIETII